MGWADFKVPRKCCRVKIGYGSDSTQEWFYPCGNRFVDSLPRPKWPGILALPDDFVMPLTSYKGLSRLKRTRPKPVRKAWAIYIVSWRPQTTISTSSIRKIDRPVSGTGLGFCHLTSLSSPRGCTDICWMFWFKMSIQLGPALILLINVEFQGVIAIMIAFPN